MRARTTNEGNRGQALIVGIVFVAVLLTFGAVLTNRTIQTSKQQQQNALAIQTRTLSEAGIEKAIFCLNQVSGANCGGTFGLNYAGESNVPLGNGVFSAILTSLSDEPGRERREIISTGFIPDSANPKASFRIKAEISRNVDNASFPFGLQIGEAGVTMEQNSVINGNVFVNGSIAGVSGVRISGDAVTAHLGGAQITPAHETQTGEFRFGYNDDKTDIAQSFLATRTGIISDIELYLRRVGNPYNDIFFYIVHDIGGEPDVTEQLGKFGEGRMDANFVGTSISWVRAPLDLRPALIAGNKYWLILSPYPSSNKYFYIGEDSGDSYPQGTGRYSKDSGNEPWTNTNSDFNFRIIMNGAPNTINRVTVGNDAYTEVFSAGTVGRDLKTSSTISGSTIGRDAYAYTISGSTIGRDAYAANITGSTVGGQRLSGIGVAPPGPAPFPISSAAIERWKQEAAVGGTIINGDFRVEAESAIRLGPAVITGNFAVDNNAVLVLTGTLYVLGKIEIGNGANINLDPNFSTTSGIIISDNGIHVQEQARFAGSGAAGSYILLLSTSRTGGTHHHASIDIHGNSSGLILAAPYGKVYFHTNSTAKQVSAFSIYLKNNAIINYETGLQNVLFSSGQSGSWRVVPGSWRKIQ